MNEIKNKSDFLSEFEIYDWEWYDTEYVGGRNDNARVPKSTDENFRLLAEKYNKLIQFLAERLEEEE